MSEMSHPEPKPADTTDQAEHKILPIGVVLDVDDEGYIVSQSGPEKITAPWDAAVETLRDAYIEHLGDKLQSLYVRGSVGRGNALEGISDIDGLAVVTDDPSTIDMTWLADVKRDIKQRFPFTNGVDMAIQPYDAIAAGEKRIPAFWIKTMSACVYGEDLASSLPKVKPGPAALIAGYDLERKASADYLAEAKLTVGQKMKWSAKQILRAGFELVMEDEQKYTRDLYPCYEAFSRYYPEYEPQMRKVLENALYPTDSEEDFQAMLVSIGPWLVEQVHARYPMTKRSRQQ